MPTLLKISFCSTFFVLNGPNKLVTQPDDIHTQIHDESVQAGQLFCSFLVIGVGEPNYGDPNKRRN